MNINHIGKSFGLSLKTTGENIIRSSFPLTKEEILGHRVSDFVISKFPESKVILHDNKYYLIPWADWHKFIKWDVINLKKYIKEFHDCDDFAYIFKYRLKDLFGVSCLIVHGHIYDKDTGRWKGGHFWNAMVVKTAEGFQLYFYEPITDNWTLVNQGKIVMGSWEYRPLTFEF